MSGGAELQARIDDIWDRVDRAGGSRLDITLVAVTKGQPDAAVAAAVATGVVDLGENYAQSLHARPALPAVRWHFLGGVQRNKVKALAPLVHLWHSVDREELATDIARHQPGGRVLVQVDFTGEPGRSGCAPDDAGRIADRCAALGLDVAGLMTVAPRQADDAARRAFRGLADIGARLGVRELSMGMSDDFEIAVAEGATIVRIGTRLFGPRPQPPTARR